MLSSLGSLKELIPTISFVGVYTGFRNNVKVSTWKFGISTVYNTGLWTTPDGAGSHVTTILVSPGSILTPYGTCSSSIVFANNAIDCSDYGGFTALLFNY